MKKTTFTLILLWLLCMQAFAQIGSIDPAFNAGTGFGPDQWTGKCETIVQQSDGKLLVGGQFKSYNGSSAHYIARLNLDGSLDQSLVSPFDDSWGANVSQIKVLSNGKILVCGTYLQSNGTALPGIVRLNADGSIDQSFSAPAAVSACRTFDVQPDGKILLGNLIRLNTDGSVDNSFNAGTGIAGGAGFGGVGVNKLVIQADGKILIGGHFGSYNGSPSILLARLNSDGTIDPTFNANANFSPAIDGFYGQVYEVELLPNGKILIGGNYGNTNSLAFGVARLHADGSLDTAFEITHSTELRNFALDVQSDGKILAANVNFGLPSEAFVVERYHPDGALDTDFPKKFVNNDVKDLIIQQDGNITFVGYFHYNPTGIMRLIGDSPVNLPSIEATALHFEIYPNPAVEKVLIDHAPEGSVLSIVDLAGKLVHRSIVEKEQIQLPASSFKSGTYIVRLDHKGQLATAKLIIQD